MKHLILYLLVFSLLLTSAEPAYALFLEEKPEGEWEGYKSTHFIIYYHPSISKKYIKEFNKKCEMYYDVITERLGFNRFNFWLWEDRAKILIYETKEDYIKDTNRPQWSGGSVNIDKKEINTYYFAEDFFDNVLPHELSHIILKEFIGLNTIVPLWFDEGVACVNEKDSISRYFLYIKVLADREVNMKVSVLEKMTPKEILLPDMFYGTSASLIVFLLEKYGKEDFVDFCKELKKKTKFYKAMKEVYDIKNQDELNKEFLKFIKNKDYNDIVNRADFSVKW